ncbi:Sec-independent protein translocase protein TatB [Thalassospira tepidiphila]|uniref:Sec-independent protein translocase protein TatB n=2 Tax=Thalassospira tepidiphila TaxID=393657 RepID=A0A853KZE5_9PROT|nr:Sec-independent protein translocase protein TatB [Thalassospira tepidiphila]NJB75293.1 sec-independent protein translocase protein TatB [Thalassospira tepidiphila]OAZ09295.1 TatABCE protein translocation system subunit [Thalassospira tepidiphila MCCC 1A03514]
MFDIGWTEMALVAVVALFVVGPKELPHLLYKLAGYWKKVRGMAREFQSGIDDIIREAELDDLRKQVNSSHSNPTDFLENKISSPKSDGKKTESKPKAEKPAEKAETPAAKSATTTGTPADDSKKKDQPESQA